MTNYAPPVKPAAAAKPYSAKISDTVSKGLTVERFVGAGRATPGNVGLCLSGGGSRALSAGMGQLRALNYLTAKKNGPSLLSQVKAISTVSGGSWLGVSFTYLNGKTSDTDFLNAYVANPHDLVPSKGSSIAVTLDKLPRGNMGVPSTSRLFSVPALAVEAYLLWKIFGTPANMLWQVLMGFHIMSEHNLYSPGAQALPTSLFSWDKKTLKQTVVGPNPSLATETAHLVASGAGRTPRPYILCNTAMFVKKGKTQLLAPVQATPFFTGIVGTPDAVDANGRKVGGGGVTSFAFNSALQKVSGSAVTVTQARQWSLTDIVGASSAAFAGQLQQVINDPLLFAKYLLEFGQEIWDWLKKHLSSADLAKVNEARIQSFLKTPTLTEVVADMASFDPGALIPAYDYWPVRNAKPNAKLKPTRFADGGNLENTGVASMLSYGDIDSVIACVNSETPMTKGKKGVVDPKTGKEIPKTRIIVDGQIPPLFGYQPYDPKKGYVPFGKKTAKANIFMSQSQVFPTGDFSALLKALWKNSGSGKNTRPANALQKLKTKKNDWFGVARRDVTVLWVYTNAVETWVSLLRPDVKKLVAASADFPHYNTLDTNLSAAQVNLLASLTAWCVADPSNRKDFVGLFK